MLPGVTRAWEHKPCNKSEGAWEEWTGAGWQLDQENVPLQASAVAEARTDVHPSRMGWTAQAGAATQSKHSANSP